MPRRNRRRSKHSVPFATSHPAERPQRAGDAPRAGLNYLVELTLKPQGFHRFTVQTQFQQLDLVLKARAGSIGFCHRHRMAFDNLGVLRFEAHMLCIQIRISRIELRHLGGQSIALGPQHRYARLQGQRMIADHGMPGTHDFQRAGQRHGLRNRHGHVEPQRGAHMRWLAASRR
jgi:hypothetical protein